MLPATQHIRQTRCRSGFAGTRCHNQQVLPEPKTDLLTNSTNCFLLIISISNLIVDGNRHQIQTLRPTVHQLLQITLAEYTANFTLRAALIVPEVGFETVGSEHHWTATKFALQAVCVQDGLFASDVRIFT